MYIHLLSSHTHAQSYFSPNNMCSYDIMTKCWRCVPSERPTFPELQQTFADMLLEEVNYMQLTSLTEYVLPPPIAVTRSVEHYNTQNIYHAI